MNPMNHFLNPCKILVASMPQSKEFHSLATDFINEYHLICCCEQASASFA